MKDAGQTIRIKPDTPDVPLDTSGFFAVSRLPQPRIPLATGFGLSLSVYAPMVKGMSRAIVLEVNEMPLRVLDWWQARVPDSPLAQLANSGTVVETVLDEALPRDLYPSQSWASVGMGVPWEKHGVFWYGDPKPSEFPFYWQAAAAAGASVGMVGVLHSSPLAEQCSDKNFRFVIPDCFSAEEGTLPPELGSLQQLNLRFSRQSARVATLRPGPADLGAAVQFVRHGLRPSTVGQLGRLVTMVGSRQWNKERLRAGQALAFADIFAQQTQRHDPDLAVFFTNHVASAMHRYWAATFPDDWAAGPPYSNQWRCKYEDELPYAMRILDRIVRQLADLAKRTSRVLLIVTSMGQQADLSVHAGASRQAVVRDPERFLLALGVDEPFKIRGAMVPQVTVELENADATAAVESKIRASLGSALGETMTAELTLTFSYDLECDGDRVRLGDATHQPDALGVTIEEISDHRSGHHSPRGLLLASEVHRWPAEIDAFDVAPMLLEVLGINPLSHHKSLATIQ